MKNKELIEKIEYVLSRNKKCSITSCLKKHAPDYYNAIFENTKFLDKYGNIPILERLYCIKNNLFDRPLCQNCKKEHVCSFDNVKNIYRKWCSPKCQASDMSCQLKSEQTSLKKYGNSHYNNNDQAKYTRLLKNNGHYHSTDFGDKVKQTKLINHGDANYVNIEKIKQTKLEKYGDENYVNIEKAKQTKLEKYGNENYNNAKQISETKQNFSNEKNSAINEKRLKTNNEKYGYDFPTQSQKIKDKTKSTCIIKYGAKSVLVADFAQYKQKQKMREKSWNYIIKDNDYSPCFSKDEYINNTDKSVWKWKCNKCGNEFEALYDNGMHHRCYKCYPNVKYGTSLLEQELTAYVKNICVHEIQCHKKDILSDHREIDIYIPELKIGIEFNGLYYHSEARGKDKFYHISKLKDCEEKGVRLINIFEDDWVNKKKIVKSRLKHIICKNQRRIFARKCKIKEIAPNIKDTFLDKYHLQGHDISSIRYGLFYKTYLVAIMTFVKSRFNSKYEWELSRYATISNFTVIGGASKLLKHFERNNNPKSLITYADRCWSNGNLYYKIGFKLLRKTQPGYQYTKNGYKFNRINFQKHKLKDKLEKFDPTKSEVENMKDNGYYRIFDCGNMVFEKIY